MSRCSTPKGRAPRSAREALFDRGGYIATAVATEPARVLFLPRADLLGLGTVRELVARAFAQLEANGIIARTRARIAIRDPERLRAVARGEVLAAPRSGRGVT